MGVFVKKPQVFICLYLALSVSACLRDGAGFFRTSILLLSFSTRSTNGIAPQLVRIYSCI